MSHASTIHEVDAGDFCVRSVLIHGAKFSLVWDTLTRPADMAEFADACAGRRCLVAYSHADWDHVQGTAAFGDAVVIGHTECLRRFHEEARQTLAELQAGQPRKWNDVRLFPPDITFTRSLNLDLGGLAVSLHALPGHTPDSIVAFIPAMGLLLAGDAVELPCPCVPADCDLEAWIGGLAHWLDHAGTLRVIASHGPCGGKEILQRTIDYLTGLRQGTPLPMPDDASPFYAQTHAANLKNCTLRTNTQPPCLAP
jgi:glyoxylase-like metal-dependent hydrolase (beta-lactamase superfamily II)